MATIEKYSTSKGSLWRVRFRTPDRKQTQRRGFTTKRDAELFAVTVEVTKARGEYVSVTAGRVTIAELGPAWLDRQRGHMKPSGFRSYESAWRNHVSPRWGQTHISDIRYSDVQAWVAELAARLSASLVANTYSVLGRIHDDAVRDRALASNPARGVKLPKRPPRKNVYLTAEQLNTLAVESGRYGPAATLRHRPRSAHGSRVRSSGARPPIRRSPASPPTICGTPPHRWRSRPGRIRRWFNGCSATPRRR